MHQSNPEAKTLHTNSERKTDRKSTISIKSDRREVVREGRDVTGGLCLFTGLKLGTVGVHSILSSGLEGAWLTFNEIQLSHVTRQRT